MTQLSEKQNHDMKELLKMCRYYKGEEHNPFRDQNRSMLWFYERAWIYEKQNNSNNLSLAIEEYIRIGLGLFEQFDDVPLSLKALLFNRYAKTSQSLLDAVEPFKKFYKEYY
jgi:hypothetical protein